MTPIKFIHTADWHICDYQYCRTFRGEDVTRAVWEIVDLAIAEKFDFIINGGDTFQIKTPSGGMLDLLFAVHHKLKAAGIPMFVVTGNHDMMTPTFLKLPAYESDDNEMAGVVCIDNRIIEYKGLKIAGFPGHPWQEVAPLIEAMEPVDILCWHGAIDAFVPFPMDNAWPIGDIPRGKARAWLLGDIHLPGRQRLEDGTLVGYPGPIELREQGEPAQKHVDIYTLQEGWRAGDFPEPFEYELDTRKVVFLSINDEKQADQALGVVRQAVLDTPDRMPMVFLRYAREMKHSVTRIRELLDLRFTVFRAATAAAVYRSAVRTGESGVGRPLLPGVVDQVLPPGTPLNVLAQTLAVSGADIRLHLTHWIEEQMRLTAVPEGLPRILPPATATAIPENSIVESDYESKPLF